MKIKKWQLYITGVCIISGALLAWQYRIHTSNLAVSQSRNSALAAVIQELEAETARMEEQIVAFRGKLDKIQHSQVNGADEVAFIQAEMQGLKNLSGLSEVTGPGITVVLDDNRTGSQAAKSLPDYNAENFIIHDKNVLYLVNEIKRAGAEAIAVNNQRIVTSSDIRCVGPVIFVNSTRMAPPYVIQAIGDPETLERAVALGEEFPYLKYKDFPVKLVREPAITLPAYKGSLIQNYVKPAEEGGAVQ